MASFVMFHIFPRILVAGGHDLDTQVSNIALSNVQPNAAVDVALTTITQIAAINGYTAGGLPATYVSSNQSSGLCTLILADVTFTAAGGSMGPFRYAVLHRANTGSLIGYWDYGAPITLSDGQSWTVDLSAVNGVFKMS